LSSYVANRGRGGRGRGGGGHNNSSRGRGSGRGQESSRPRQPRSNFRDQRCQVCFKKGHAANECWHRFDENYVPDDKLVGAAYNSYDVDTNWYMDPVHLTTLQAT
jgi:hypothetical protein